MKLFLVTGSFLLGISSPLFSHTSFTTEDRVNYPSNYQVEKGIDLFVYGDYLYWIAQEDGLVFAQTGKGKDGTSFKGNLEKIDPSWENAYRVALGLNFPKEGYDLIGLWTHLSTTSSQSSNGNLFPLWGHPDASATSSATFAKGHWNLNLNILDLEWGRSSWFGGHFSLRPFFGVRWLKLDQTLKNTYLYESSPVTSGHLLSFSDFNGGGIRAGAESRYNIPYGFSFWGLISGTLLYGNYNTHLSIKEDSLKIANAKDSTLNPLSTLQLGIGVGWDSHFCKDRFHIELHLGWEQNLLFNANRMNHYMGALSKGLYFKEKGNLTLQGLVVGSRFDF